MDAHSLVSPPVLEGIEHAFPITMVWHALGFLCYASRLDRSESYDTFALVAYPIQAYENKGNSLPTPCAVFDYSANIRQYPLVHSEVG